MGRGGKTETKDAEAPPIKNIEDASARTGDGGFGREVASTHSQLRDAVLEGGEVQRGITKGVSLPCICCGLLQRARTCRTTISTF